MREEHKGSHAEVSGGVGNDEMGGGGLRAPALREAGGPKTAESGEDEEETAMGGVSVAEAEDEVVVPAGDGDGALRLTLSIMRSICMSCIDTRLASSGRSLAKDPEDLVAAPLAPFASALVMDTSRER